MLNVEIHSDAVRLLMQEEILHHARMLCGIAVGNPIQQALLIVVVMVSRGRLLDSSRGVY